MIVDKADSKGYFDRIEGLINKYHIKIIIPTSEPELRLLNRKNILDNIAGASILICNKKALETGLDKLRTANFLKESSLPYPQTSVVGESDPVSFPCIIKARECWGSHDIKIVEPELINYYKKTRPDHIWQEYLQPDDEEYTCGLFRSNNKETREIIFRRKLRNGVTIFGEVVDDKEIKTVLLAIADGLNLSGSINVQLRKTKKGPVVFEINPRFSSTVLFRHMLGFRDLQWSLHEELNYPIGKYKQNNYGRKIYRVFREIII